MVDRFLVWVSAGLITVGMSAAMLGGAGLAIADNDASSDTGTSTSESSNSTDGEQNSDDGAGSDDQAPDDPTTPDDPTADPDLGEDEQPDEEPAEEPDQPADDETGSDDDTTETDRSGRDRKETTSVPAATTKTSDRRVATEPTIKAIVAGTEEPTEPASPVEEQPTTVVIDTPVADLAETPEVQAVAFASVPTAAAVNATATAPQIPGIIRVLGTIVFNLYAVATRVFGGPPMLPANSSVTVRSSSLTLKCGCEDGDTIEVPADWYIPEAEEGDPPPTRLVYLQHGFLASGPWYSHTAAALAEQTNSIVVAPSITSNFLAADACWLGAAPMHEAIAGLFADGNTALAASALAAGYTGPIPDRVVLMGHSLGGGAVSGAAGFMVENLSIDRLAGVVLLDGVGLEADGAMAASLDDVPDAIPIYQLAAPKYFWNQFGVGSAALQQARPDAFIGVTLVGGAHVDTMRGGNPLIQFAQQLVSGFSKPQNVAAAEQIMVGWVNDMFAGNHEQGLYLEPDEQVSIDTPRGEATAVALPNSLTKPFLFNFLQPFASLGNGFFTFEPTCVAASMGTSSGCQESIAA